MSVKDGEVVVKHKGVRDCAYEAFIAAKLQDHKVCETLQNSWQCSFKPAVGDNVCGLLQDTKGQLPSRAGWVD